jgi:hypothetical protein
MKPMFRRLRLLEQAYQVEEYVEREDSPAAILRARRLRRLQMEGGPFRSQSHRSSIRAACRSLKYFSKAGRERTVALRLRRETN